MVVRIEWEIVEWFMIRWREVRVGREEVKRWERSGTG